MGLIYDQLGELQTYIELQERGLLLSREMKNREHEGSALNNIGNGYKTLGDYEKAIFYLTQALEIQRESVLRIVLRVAAGVAVTACEVRLL